MFFPLSSSSFDARDLAVGVRIGINHFHRGEWKNPDPASLREERYSPLQHHQEPIRKSNQEIDVDADPQ